ncbi:MAG: SIMPL domain-containing protein [Nanoarchaeota archaeon]|nr:SIMPL domain-containing protein [Nanoarchaeota archaeon]
MKNSIQITLIVAATAIIIALMGIYVYNQQMPSSNTVSVTGESSINAVPDLVTVYFSVETEAKTSQESKDKNSEIVDKLTNNLIQWGFEKKDIVTENYNIYPDYSWVNNQQVLKGYKTVHSIKVELSADKTEKIGNVIDAGADAGALISYINFELSPMKQSEYKAQALENAGRDAKTKAAAIAKGLGKNVGSIVSITDSSFDYYPWRLYSSAEAGAGKLDSTGIESAKTAITNIQPGEKEITARISVVYKLK